MTDRARDAVLALLTRRAPEGTVCPSEVARTLDAAEWRTQMPAVHSAIDGLVAGGVVRLSWKGEAMATRAGPYRIGRG